MNRALVIGPLAVLLACLGLLVSCTVEGGPADQDWESFTAPHRHDLDLGGHLMRYTDIGQGPPVMMLHGFASTSYCWYLNARPLLDAGYRVILIDLPGQGQSTVPPDSFSPKVENMAASVIRLADELKLEKFAVVGASMGGGLTLYLSWRYPDRIRKAVVIDPASFDQEKPYLLGLMSNPKLGPIIAQVAGRWSVKASLLDTAYLDEAITEIYIDEFSRALAKPGFKAYMSRLLRDFFSPEFAKMVGSYEKISVPMLILWGQKDKWVPPEFGPRLHKLIPGSKFVPVEECGHMPHVETPQITNPLLIEFLAEEPQAEEAEPQPMTEEGEPKPETTEEEATVI